MGNRNHDDIAANINAVMDRASQNVLDPTVGDTLDQSAVAMLAICAGLLLDIRYHLANPAQALTDEDFRTKKMRSAEH